MRLAAITLAIVLTGGLLASWFLKTHERVVVEQTAALQGEARVNNFLAAEMVLSRFGIEADSRSTLTPSDWMPSPSDTLVVRVSPALTTAGELALLDAWVANGGHLVLLAPETPLASTDDMLEHFGFRLSEAEFGSDPYVARRVIGDPESATAGYTVERTHFRQRLELIGAVDGATLVDEHGYAAARRSWGGGITTIIAGSTLFDNLALHQSDHVRLLLDALAGHVAPGKVWFIYDDRYPSLWQLAWQRTPFVVAGIVVTVAVLLWAAIPRFGPAITQTAPERRSILEHVKAAGETTWRYQGAGSLVESSVAALMRRAAARHPEIGRLPPDEQAALIAGMTGRPADKVLEALDPRRALGHREFARAMQALQSMRKDL